MKTGELLMITSGVYSDFGHLGLFTVAKDFDGKEALAAYLKEFPEEAQEYGGSEYKFAAWLMKHGYINDVDYTTWHVGEYGNFDRATEPAKHDPSQDFWWRKESA